MNITLREVDPESGTMVNPQHIVEIETSLTDTRDPITTIYLLGCRSVTVKATRDVVLLRLAGAR